MRVLICGSRHFTNYDFMGTWIWKELFSKVEGFNITEIIHGGARGADTLAGLYAERHETPCKVFPADWDKYGKAAGPIRNKQMLDEGKPDLVIAFRGPNSRGTQNMIDQATKAGIPVQIVDI